LKGLAIPNEPKEAQRLGKVTMGTNVEWANSKYGGFFLRSKGVTYACRSGKWVETSEKPEDEWTTAPAWALEGFSTPESDDSSCSRCSGSGKTVWKHVAGGICFKCEGTGSNLKGARGVSLKGKS